MGSSCPASTTVTVMLTALSDGGNVIGTPASFQTGCALGSSTASQKLDVTYTASGCQGGSFPASGTTLGSVAVAATTSGGGVGGETANATRTVRCSN